MISVLRFFLSRSKVAGAKVSRNQTGLPSPFGNLRDSSLSYSTGYAGYTDKMLASNEIGASNTNGEADRARQIYRQLIPPLTLGADKIDLHQLVLPGC